MQASQRTRSGERTTTWFRARTDQLGAFREWIRARLDEVSWLSPSRSADIVLASSELATNAVEHGTGDHVGAEIETTEDALEVTVESEGELGDDAWDANRPDPSSVTGRGLVIVRAVADSVTRVVQAGRTRISARFERRS